MAKKDLVLVIPAIAATIAFSMVALGTNDSLLTGYPANALSLKASSKAFAFDASAAFSQFSSPTSSKAAKYIETGVNNPI